MAPISTNDHDEHANEEQASGLVQHAEQILTPAEHYAELFEAVQMNRVFPDSKTFVDCIPKEQPALILDAYRSQHNKAGFKLDAFVREYFEHPPSTANHYHSTPGDSLKDHIDGLWDVLTREHESLPKASSLLALPHPYVVPGGRFTELYYWDSYFTMIGLAESGRRDLLKSMAGNFAYLIDTYGHIPNGNRSYYLSRSQPPVFALMVELFEQTNIKDAIEYLPQLRKEYAFWMNGAAQVDVGEAFCHVVRLDNDTVLNRYWDARDTPRDESYLEDILTARAATQRKPEDIFRDLRAGAATGWDYSSRWCDDEGLSSIRTTAIIPVDLNCLLWKLEQQIALLSRENGDHDTAAHFEKLQTERRRAIDHYLWNEQEGAYFDYDWQRQQPRTKLNAATSAPLYVRIASRHQAHKVDQTIRRRLLSQGGIETTHVVTGQQWDRPNGWAPLQWLAIRGLRRYDHHQLSEEIGQRWLHTVSSLYEREGKLVEKYVLDSLHGGSAVGGGGGEYPLQDGFGWTNGVTRRLLHETPKHAAHHSRSRHR